MIFRNKSFGGGSNEIRADRDRDDENNRRGAPPPLPIEFFLPTDFLVALFYLKELLSFSLLTVVPDSTTPSTPPQTTQPPASTPQTLLPIVTLSMTREPFEKAYKVGLNNIDYCITKLLGLSLHIVYCNGIGAVQFLPNHYLSAFQRKAPGQL